MKRRITGILLALLMALALLPATAWANETWSSDVTLSDNKVLTGTVTISGNVTLSGTGTIKRGTGCTGAMIVVPSGAKLTIEGSVTLDGTPVGCTEVNSAAIQVDVGGTLIMKGGTICNNVNRGNGGGVNNAGTFELKGGMIRDNKATGTGSGKGTGGGIRNESTGALTITGGTISGNYAQDGGCGVFNYNGTLRMSGGTITGNYGGDRGGGISHRATSTSGVFEISGNPVITGNYNGGQKDINGNITGGTINNVGLITSGGTKNFITIGGAMTEGADVQVSVVANLNTQEQINAENTAHTYIRAGQNHKITTSDVERFHIDNGGQKFFKLTDNNQVFIALPEAGVTKYTVTVKFDNTVAADAGSVSLLTQTVSVGDDIKNLYFYPAEGYYFPEKYDTSSVSANGIQVQRLNSRQLRVYGTPSDNVTITLPAASKLLKGSVTISGTPKVGQTLTATATIDGLVGNMVYQWYYSNGATSTLISGATGSTYVLTAADLGKYIYVRVSDSGRPDRDLNLVSNSIGPVVGADDNTTVTPVTPSTGTSSGNTSSGLTLVPVKTADEVKSTSNYSGGIYGLTFQFSGSYSSFQRVEVDGKVIDADSYIAEANSSGTEIYLKAVFLRTLADGKHTITAVSSAGSASAEFTIGGDIITAAQTFDAGVAVYGVSALLSLSGMAWLGRKREN